MDQKEENAIILDYLPYGYPMGEKNMPLAQAVGETTFVLLELTPRRGVNLEQKEKVYIGSGKRDKIYFIVGKLPKEKMTEAAKIQLQEFVKEKVGEQEEKFLNFFNIARPINTRLHQLELLPGFGKKHTKELVEARKEKPFKSFDDIKERVPSLPDPKKAIEKRLLEELLEKPRFNVFVQ